MVGASLLAVALAAAAPPLPAAPAPPAAAAPAKSGSVQAAFDAATEAYAASRWQDAVQQFDALEARLGTKAKATVGATINLRRGIALSYLGQPDRAKTSLRAALAAIAPDDPTLGEERLGGQVALASVLVGESDFAEAREVVKAASARAKTSDYQLRLAVLGMQSTMFEPGDDAPRYAAEAERIVRAKQPLDNKQLAQVDTLHARLMLIRGDKSGGYDLLKKALARQGGLDLRVTLAEVVTRSDLTIAALLNRDEESARKYLAYTGAGRIANSPFSFVGSLPLPPCGGTPRIDPDDSAIVEFGIDPVGAVSYAHTVYMSRPSSVVAKLFSDAVAEWKWTPESIGKMPAFYRGLTRVELRCSNAVDRPQFFASLMDARAEFLVKHLSALPSLGFDEATLPALKAELARRQPVAGDPVVPALMIMIALNAGSAQTDAVKLMEGARDLLPADAPVRLRAALAFQLAMYAKDSGRSNAEEWRNRLRTALANPAFAADPVVNGTLRLAIAQASFERAAPRDAIDLVQAVADDDRLDKDDPLKTAALLRLATLQSQARQLAAAQASFARTGLTGDQCALLDTPPAIKRSGVSSNDFPIDAQRWGFEGWVRTEQDILADGTTRGTRAVLIYPPFVFREAAVTMASAIRYEPVFRPGSTAGCAANQQGIRFKMQSSSE